MIIPSIDLMGGEAVQLIGGEQLAIAAGDPRPLLDRFSLAGEVAVIDLDAARGEGSNAELIRELCQRARVRVGGGIRSVETARRWLDAGASKVILGTAASPELLRALPRERTIVALDSRDGDVVTHGWRRRTGRSVTERMRALAPFCGGFLVTFVEREGRLVGTDLTRAAAAVEAAGSARVTVAGGVRSAEEIAELDRLGADAQVGMALYDGSLPLAEAVAAPLRSERADGLWPTVVSDERGMTLGLAWSSATSLRVALEDRAGVYHSRSRGLWRKGEDSGARQELLGVDLDCDRDALRFTVRQAGSGFCHLGTRSCFGAARGLGALEARLAERLANAPEDSITRRLADDPALLRAKLVEEAGELAQATSPAEVREEAADLLYFALVRAAAAGVRLAEVEEVLDRRALRVSRRACEAKEAR